MMLLSCDCNTHTNVCQQMQISLIIFDMHGILKKGEITVF